MEPTPTPPAPMPPRPLYRFVVNDPEHGELAAITHLSPDELERFGGLPGVAVLAREKSADLPPGPDNLEWNGAFLELLHRTVREIYPTLPEVIAAKFAPDATYLFVRATRPGRTGPSDRPEDIVGRFAIAAGRMVPDQYEVHHGFLPISADGAFILHPDVERGMLERMAEAQQG